jgi:hypothetical protein
MSVLNKFIKKKTGFQSAPETSTRLYAADPTVTELVLQTRIRRVGSETYTYTGGSREAADALQIELEATPDMGEVYGYSNGPDPDNPNEPETWTVSATLTITGAWGEWT